MAISRTGCRWLTTALTSPASSALGHFFHLFAAGELDSLYSALPTRIAARELYERVFAFVKSAFDEDHPPVVLAVPVTCKSVASVLRRRPPLISDRTAPRPTGWMANGIEATELDGPLETEGRTLRFRYGGKTFRHTRLGLEFDDER